MYGTDSDSLVVNGLLQCMVDIGNEVGVAPEDQQNGALEIIAAIRELKRERDTHKSAEEAQIALREKADEREAALAAQIESLLAAGDLLREPWDLGNILGPETRRRVEGWDKAKARVDAPATSLARRDAEQRGKALAETAKWFAALHTSTELLSAEVVYDILMDQSRRQTEALP